LNAAVTLESVDKRYATGTQALEQIDLSIGRGEFVSIVGPSGCGKSTLLRIIAGLEQPSNGLVSLSPSAGGAGPLPLSYVFQEPTLMPWASVFENVWLPLRLAGHSRAQTRSQILRLLAGVGLESFEAAYPHALSGGMKMRVSIARALASAPELLLMDEPFAALDEMTRERLDLDLLDWWKERQLTAVFVTHSVYEAVFLSQRVVVMSGRPGRILEQIQIDEPYPRNEGFRLTARYVQCCAQVAAALRRDGARRDASPDPEQRDG
jgi:NitT/TauT family transport system ATP-binding protein